MKLKRHIDDVIEALTDGFRKAGDGVSMKTRHMKDKNDEIHLKTKDLDNELAGRSTGGRGRTPDALTDQQYSDLLELSVHNPGAPQAVLGKFRVEGTASYIDVAEGWDPPATYFSVGAEWDSIKAVTGMNDDGMFESLNIPFLDRIVQGGKEIHFSHNPEEHGGALLSELEYLTEVHGYTFDAKNMIAIPPAKS